MLNARNVVPVESRIFHGAEIWLILQALGAAPPEMVAPSELAPSADAVRLAEQSLIHQGVLGIDAKAGSRLSAEIDALIRPTAFPDTVCILNVTTRFTNSQDSQMVTFSHLSRSFVANWVDEDNNHHFELYSPGDVEHSIWKHLLRICDLDIEEPDGIDDQSDPSTIQQAIQQMKQTVLLMCIEPFWPLEQGQRALSWFISDRHAWLIERQAAIEQLPKRVGRDTIMGAVQAFLSPQFSAGDQL